MIIQENRAWRNSVVLKNVTYIIEASIYQDELDVNNPVKKYVQRFFGAAASSSLVTFGACPS